ncbi:hypothetical protein AUQ37_00270 [Candidatus Methanomethylophilus sp. 1R26]|uniref:hypothetical protein n=1 Tax=Candidatus Methanomethylophilus sp. 1R26 TaxID=1769296 RepID=UPI0007372FFD|nr:hypothetical protein [Candidatus Methanomethylophilus sp. 1R26]KUE74442.1 hypothetical protein AUQ37_00270 [Candidatus Methanomethylophilus sp. 1R26]
MKMIVVAGMPGAGKEEFLSAGRAAGIPFVRMGDLVREFYAASGAEAAASAWASSQEPNAMPTGPISGQRGPSKKLRETSS